PIFSPPTPSTPKATTVQFIARGTYSDSSILDITTAVAWTSDSAVIAAMSNAPGSQGLASAVGVGTTGVHATLQGVTGSTTITVTAATLQSITVTPGSSTLVMGDKQAMAATGNYSDG